MKPPLTGPTISRSAEHSRESSLNRLHSPANLANASAAGSLSPRFATGRVRALSGSRDTSGDLGQNTYGHHRNTSIVHGIQHSRNGSAASNTSSPLSPQIIAAAGGGSALGFNASNMAPNDNEPLASPLLSMSGNSSFSNSSTLLADRGSNMTDPSFNSLTAKRVERVHSGRSRREHAHHRSQSRHHYKEEVKTVGEYALHVLFTSVSLCMPLFASAKANQL